MAYKIASNDSPDELINKGLKKANKKNALKNELKNIWQINRIGLRKKNLNTNPDYKEQTTGALGQLV